MNLKRCLLVFILLAVLSTPALADTDMCSAPTVYVPQTAEGDSIPAETAALLNLRFTQTLQGANPGVRISSAAEIGELLRDEQERMAAGTDNGDIRVSIGQKVNAEYVAAFSVGQVGSRYVVTSSIADADLFIVVARAAVEAASADGLDGAVSQAAADLGDLSGRIRAHEKTHPVPPRGPSLSAIISPTSVTSEDIRETTTITVTVTNCAGKPVPDTRVYFEATTARGQVTGEGKSEEPGWYGWQYAVTGPDGTARATYRLVASKGTGAGKDTVTIGTDGRGGMDAAARVDIPITGVMLEARPTKPEIPPEGQTDITVTLFELSPDGDRRPLADRTLNLEKFRLSDGVRVIVAGETDTKGNPVTDANGEVLLKFIAGTKEGTEQMRILFQDVGRGYPDAVDAWVEIRVKKDEYAGTVNWKESGRMAYEYSFQSMHDFIAYDYSFSLTGHTIKEKSTGKEQTDASYTFTDSSDIFSSGYTPYETSPTGDHYDIVPFEEEWLVESSIRGRVNDYPTINRVMNEKFSSYEIPVSPYPVLLPATGAHSYDVAVTWFVHGTPHTGTDSGTIPAVGTLAVGGARPVTAIRMKSLPNLDSEDPDRWVRDTLMRQGDGINEKMSALSDARITGLMKQTGKNVYERSWSTRDAGSYHDTLFTFLDSDAIMDLEQSFTRDVTLRVVKL
ncbi:hypothetical protein L1S32_00475 [Methanogenium sp. S4BF]|uniref:hypothetical protein n=1 Tax=Methanogenium sp. S4BF TaxID=1789226 RepID=UPI002417D1C1|nr:hypothetical protein [Methanogenium sp. S4BF]WFN34631.1 hypothetical protein L1S32_00475 [Methanogenium sp. S4BF]